ncbi:MAG: TetR/AcrR family transcriptional regulator [Candidatus Binataceae bacterium]
MNSAAEIPSILSPGRRERGKRAKLERIKRAARILFSRRGFDATTTRAIASAADIGAGTLFLYAGSKEDLLVLIFREEVGAAVDRAVATVPARTLLEQIMHVFSAMIAHHAANPALARIFVKELPFAEDARHGVADFVRKLFTAMTGLIERAKARGEIRADVASWQLAENLFGLFFQRLQQWLGSRRPGSADSRSRVRTTLELQLMGLRPSRATPVKQPHATRARRVAGGSGKLIARNR